VTVFSRFSFNSYLYKILSPVFCFSVCTASDNDFVSSVLSFLFMNSILTSFSLDVIFLPDSVITPSEFILAFTGNKKLKPNTLSEPVIPLFSPSPIHEHRLAFPQQSAFVSPYFRLFSSLQDRHS